MKIRNYYSRMLPYAIAVILLFLSVISFPLLFIMKKNEETKYGDFMQKASEFEENGIFVDAEAIYAEALGTEGDKYAVYLGLARCRRQLNEKKTFLDSCEKAIETDCTRYEAYLLLISYYVDNKNYSEAFAVSERAVQNGCQSPLIDAEIEKLDGLFVERYLSADSVGDWNNSADTAYAVYSRNGLYGIIRADGFISLNAGYEKLGVFSAKSMTFPAYSDGLWGWMDQNGNKKIAAPQNCTEAGSFTGTYAPVCTDGKWYYADKNGKLSLSGFDFAGCFSNGVAAVEKNGKWALIGETLCSLTAYEFDGIKTDSNSVCSGYGIVIVRKEKLYYLCSLKGEILSGGFEDIALPAEKDAFIAFREGDKWGFTDVYGNVVISPQFDCAGSFSNGLAPVKTGGSWYYIRPDGTAVNGNLYDEAGCFSCEGRAIVRKENRLYTVTLSRYS